MTATEEWLLRKWRERIEPLPEGFSLAVNVRGSQYSLSLLYDKNSQGGESNGRADCETICSFNIGNGCDQNLPASIKSQVRIAWQKFQT